MPSQALKLVNTKALLETTASALDSAQASLAPRLFCGNSACCAYTLRVSDERTEPESDSKAEGGF